MIARATAAACAAVALASAGLADARTATPAGAGAAAPTTLQLRLPALASGFCMDVLSRKLVLPTEPDAEGAVLARYGLTAGVPGPVMRTMGGGEVALFSRAVLASGETSDGGYAVAVGGNAGDSCRIVVYRAPLDRLFVQATFEAMKLPGTGWRALPPPTQPPDTLKVSLIKRDAANRPYLANLYAPMGRGPVAAVLVVAVIPPDVTVPEGF